MAAIAVLAAGCANTSDGIRVVWHVITPEQAATACQSINFDRVGCFRWIGNACHVWAPDPPPANGRWDLSTLGHEVKHCFHGYFHPGGPATELYAPVRLHRGMPGT